MRTLPITGGAHMRVVLLTILLALVGCAPSLTGANERGGMVSHVGGWNRAESLALADEHCHKFGRLARISGTSPMDSMITFDCVN
jgi:hypothetical protein